jgi:hypothetical protein
LACYSGTKKNRLTEGESERAYKLLDEVLELFQKMGAKGDW